MKIKIVEHEGGGVFDILCEYETSNPEIFTEGRKITLSSDEVHIVKRSWFNVPTETLHVQVEKIGSMSEWINGFYDQDNDGIGTLCC